MRHFARPLAVVLAAQQLLYSVPAAGTVQLDDGRHFDDAALLQLSAASSASVPSNLFGGEAVHGMPIVVPPGVGEATPSISLGYRSRGPNGALGLGWSLELGVPAMIERSIRDGAPEYDASDEFELAGQRLIATGEPGRYVTERFDHGRIDYVSAGNYWRVLRPDGLRLYYGFDPSGSNASRLDSEQVMSPAPTAVDCGSGSQLETCTALHEVIPAGIPFAWYLDRIEDRNGNAIRLSWSSLGDPGARYLTRIDYGYHVPNTSPLPAFGSATTQSAPLARAVVFDYEVRLDAFPTFRTGFRRELRHRLKSITPQSGGAPVRRYHLGYVQSAASGRSLLEAIEVRGADDDASTARTHSFTYTDGGTPGWSATPDPAWAVQPALLDWLGRDNGVRLLDLNADGFMDVLHGNFVDQPGAYLGGPNGFSTTRDPGWTPPPIFTTDYFDRRSNGLLFGDFNGDRRIDVMRRRLQLEPWNSPSASELNPPCDDVFETIELEHGDISHEQGYYDYPAPQPPDPDGQAWLNTGSGWAPAPEHEFPKVDIAPELTSLTHPPDPPGATYPFTRSCPKEAMPTGYLFTDQSDAFWIGHGYQNGIEAVDVNGDGRDDLAYFRQMDQNEWTMVKVSPTVSRQQHVRIVESRAGVRINDPESGLAGGTFNNSHFAVTEARTPVGVPPLTWDGASVFRKAYDLPRWQLPQTRPGEWTNPNAWSQLRWCIASGYLNVGMVSAGHQRIVDVNADGLPDILSAVDHDVTPVSEALLNDGYNWIAADELPDLAARPAEDLIRLQPGQGFAMAIQPPYPTVCLYDPGTAWFQSEDRGWRVVDVNGDGGPDFLGGGRYVVVNELELVPGPTQIRLWNASAPAGSLWGPDGATGWALPEGVTFVPWPFPETSPPMPRLADVNGDGMVDIVVQAGAHLNLASPPDLLDTVTTPLGAVTDFDYRPSTAFETPSSASQLEDRQIANPEPAWVLSRTTLDPAASSVSPRS